MGDILYAPNRERVVTTNAWAFMHWLRVTRGVELADWAALARFSVEHEAEFRAAVSAFARGGGEDVDGRDRPGHDGGDVVRALADCLLHADLRPDDRVLVVGPQWPWTAVRPAGTCVVLAAADGKTLLATAEEARATVLVAPAEVIAEAAFQRRRRADLAALRTIIATGGPLSPEGRTRVYTWMKPDVMLLARTGDTLWGNPLEPVYTRPAASPGFFTRPASAPVPR